MSDRKITVDGVELPPHDAPGLPLVTFLRDELAIVAVKGSCETARCGTCTVMLDSSVVKSCTLVVGQVEGRRVRTVAGMAGDTVFETVREEFARNFAVQCGYCTVGMLLAATALLTRALEPTDEQIRAGLGGNLCRCTGYHNIVAAVRAAADRLAEGTGPA